MNITPISTYIPPIKPVDVSEITPPIEISGNQPTFLDVFKSVFNDATTLSNVTNQDKIRIMLGEADDLEMIQLNKEKAGLAVELLANVRNTVLDSYNEIIRMQI
jgi:flagellar hook-basal body complex protein FliE